jgi:Tol biopolymer transport system component
MSKLSIYGFSLRRASILSAALTFAALGLFSCGPESAYEEIPGIRLLKDTGSPIPSLLVWSPRADDQILVSVSDGEVGPSSIFVLNSSTQETKAIAESERGLLWGRSWSPDGNKLLLSANRGTSGFESGGTWIWDNASESKDYLIDASLALWSPKGDSIAVVTNSSSSQSAPISPTLQLVDPKTKQTRILESFKVGDVI